MEPARGRPPAIIKDLSRPDPVRPRNALSGRSGRRIKIPDHHLTMILIYPRPRVARPGVTSADPRCDSKYPLPALRPMGTTITRKRLAATPSSCLALLVIQLLIEVALINLEASNVQRISQRDVALNACRVCRRAESPQPNRLTRLGQPFALPPRRPTLSARPCRLCAFMGLCRQQPTRQTLGKTPRRSRF